MYMTSLSSTHLSIRIIHQLRSTDKRRAFDTANVAICIRIDLPQQPTQCQPSARTKRQRTRCVPKKCSNSQTTATTKTVRGPYDMEKSRVQHALFTAERDRSIDKRDAEVAATSAAVGCCCRAASRAHLPQRRSSSSLQSVVAFRRLCARMKSTYVHHTRFTPHSHHCPSKRVLRTYAGSTILESSAERCLPLHAALLAGRRAARQVTRTCRRMHRLQWGCSCWSLRARQARASTECASLERVRWCWIECYLRGRS